MGEGPLRPNYEESKAVRNAVLGDHGLRGPLWADEARRWIGDFHELTVETAYGAIWGRDVLSRRDRRLLTLATLVAGGYEGELQLHVRAALDDGVTVDELREVFIHMAAYVGFPKALIAFRNTWPVIEEHWAATETD